MVSLFVYVTVNFNYDLSMLAMCVVIPRSTWLTSQISELGSDDISELKRSSGKVAKACLFVCFVSYQGRAIHVPLAIRNGNRELVLIENWLPVVRFLETVSPPACWSRLSVRAIALQSAEEEKSDAV